MLTSETDQRLRARRAMRGFNQTVIQPGAYRFVERPKISPTKALPEVILLPAPELQKPKLVREPQHSSAFDDMAEAIATKSAESFALTYEQRVQADALLSRAFQFAVLMDGKRSSF